MTRMRGALLILLAAGVCLTASPIAGATPPAPNGSSTASGSTRPSPKPTPTPAQTPSPTQSSGSLSAEQGTLAQRAKDVADRRVAALARRIATESRQLAVLSTTASLAEQHFTTQQVLQADARDLETAAAQHLSVSQAAYQQAHQALVAIAVSAYQSDSAPGSVSTSSFVSLLTVDSPSDVLNGATERGMLAEHQVDVTSEMRLAVQSLRSAEQTQRAALDSVNLQTARLDQIRREADVALTKSRRALVDIKADLVAAKVGQNQADAALSTFLGGWSAADPARAGALNSHYAALALGVRHARAAVRGSHWTAAMGQTVVNRALQYLGTDYAWAAGDSSGPTQGDCVAGDARNDCHHTGFDCSGLALYAWSPYLLMAHNAATQYTYGTLHPALSALLPGDLVFWSSDGTAAGIHHVAIYVGDGNVIQAPQSGDIVRITPLKNVSSGYFGATRPMT